jgi:hypothetical protein
MAEGYRSQVEVKSTPLGGASAESFGGGAARGMIQAGESIDRAIHEIKEKRRDNEAAEAGLELSMIATEIDKAAIDGRASAAPGGDGHTESVQKLFDQRAGEAIGKIRDRRVRQVMQGRFAALREQVLGREYGWQASARVDKLAQDIDDMGSTLASGQASNPDTAGLAISIDTVEASIEAMDLPADLKTRLKKEQQRKVAVAWGNAMQVKDPALLMGALERPEFAQFLEGSDINTLRGGALVETRRAEAAERARLARERAAFIESATDLKQRVADGYIPTDEELGKLEVGAKTYADAGVAWDAGMMRTERDFNRESEDWTPVQWRDERNTLLAKGEKRSQAENIRLQLIEKKIGGAISEINNDPHAFAARSGDPAPALDFNNPASAQGRVTWARAHARANGLADPPYLSVDEIKLFQDRAAQGPAGQLEVASTMRRTFGIAVASQIVRQIDPQNRDMALMVGLPTRVGELYKRGVEAQKAGSVKLGAGDEDQQMIRDTFAEYMRGIPTDLQPAVLNAAKAITAGMAAEFGNTNPSGEELQEAFRAAVQRAGGRGGKVNDWNAPGGFAEYNGRYAWLPPTMSSNEFIRTMSRADGQAWARAAGSDPYYQGSDGRLTKMSDAQVARLKDYRLETVNPGEYRLIGPDGGHVVGKDGKPFQFDVRKLGGGSKLDADLERTRAANGGRGYVRR